MRKDQRLCPDLKEGRKEAWKEVVVAICCVLNTIYILVLLKLRWLLQISPFEQTHFILYNNFPDHLYNYTIKTMLPGCTFDYFRVRRNPDANGLWSGHTLRNAYTHENQYNYTIILRFYIKMYIFKPHYQNVCNNRIDRLLRPHINLLQFNSVRIQHSLTSSITSST